MLLAYISNGNQHIKRYKVTILLGNAALSLELVKCRLFERVLRRLFNFSFSPVRLLLEVGALSIKRNKTLNRKSSAALIAFRFKRCQGCSGRRSFDYVRFFQLCCARKCNDPVCVIE